MIQVTLQQIEERDPCDDYHILVSHLGEDFPKDKPFDMSVIFEVEGFQYPAIENALWVTRCLPEQNRMWRLFAVWCARQIQHLMTDERSINALDVAERFANGEASQEELAAAAAAAVYAAAAAAAVYAADAAAYAAAADAAAYAAAADAAAYDAAADAAAADAAAYDAAADAAAREAQQKKFIEIITAGEWVE